MFLNKLLNNKGSSLVGAIIAMITLGAAAAAIATLTSTDSSSSRDNTNLIKANALAIAGLNDGTYQLDMGQCPAGEKSFADGNYVLTSDAVSNTITATATVDKAVVTRSITTDYAVNCTSLITTDSYLEDNPDGTSTLKKILLSKTCNTQVILDELEVEVNTSDCATNLLCDGTIADNSDDDDDEVQYEECNAPWNKICICHVPPGNPDNKQTLQVSWWGWVHGHKGGNGNHSDDYSGPCEIDNAGDDEEEEVVVITCEETDDSDDILEACPESDGGLTVTKITVDDTTIFQEGSVPADSNLGGASGVPIDTLDAIMAENAFHEVEITFNTAVPVGTWATLTTTFLDESILTNTFKLGNEPGTESVYENPNEDEDAEEDPVLDDSFAVDDGTVVVSSGQQVDLSVIGSALQCGYYGPEINVRVELCIDTNCTQLWGYTDVDGGESYTTTTGNTDSSYWVKANGYLASCGSYNSTRLSTDTLQVKTLTDGQPAPGMEGFAGQQSAEAFLAEYLDNDGNVVLDSNQVIMLFEIGVDVTSNDNYPSGADFQDLVLLMTITDVVE